MSNLIIEYKDMVAFHPGYYIKDIIEENNWTQEEFAFRMETTPKTVSKLVRGEINLSDDLCIKLSNMFGTSVDVWSNLQKNYDNVLMEEEKARLLEEQKKKLKLINYNFLVETGIVEFTRNFQEKIKNIFSAFSISNLDYFFNQGKFENYRIGDSRTTEEKLVSSKLWLEVALLSGKKQEVSNFDKKLLQEKIPEIRALTLLEMNEALVKLKEIFSECGVSFVLQKHLPNSIINGAVKWETRDKVILAMSDRKKFTDVFWFSLFHEIKHVLQEKRKKIILNEEKYSDEEELDKLNENLEKEADDYAKEKLISETDFQNFLFMYDFSEESIKKFANEIGIHPGILVGRLQIEGHIPYSRCNNLRTKFYL